MTGFLGVAALLLGTLAAAGQENKAPEFDAGKWSDVVAHHPAGEPIGRVFADPNAPLPADFKPSGLTRRDYLALIAANVDFWKQHQSAEGAIVDPYARRERQYATPAFALAAAELVKEAKRDDLLEPAVRSFSFALSAVVNHTTADGHADFYIPMLMHAHRILKSRVPKDVADAWEKQFVQIIPEQTYRDHSGGANWNIVNVAGEALRRKDKLVEPDQLDAQQKYLDDMLLTQQRRFTALGMYADPNTPLAYDEFPRLWLEDMNADGAYNGPQKDAVERFLTLGGLSSLMLISPSGEWPSGGRSAQHQWNEAESAVIAEINANRWKQRHREDVAGSFKRMAHLALISMKRWQRPSGELWIVKNYFDPDQRIGFEDYSFHSQYNLLAMAMLCIAYEHADDSIAERPTPSEFASYVFDAREPFRKVVAAAGGYYALIDTTADPHYNATGLQRMHRRGVELSPLSDSSAGERVYHPLGDDARGALTPGIQWQSKLGEAFVGLAQFHRREAAQPQEQQQIVRNTDLSADSAAERTTLTIRYDLERPAARNVTEKYVISSGGVELTQTLNGDAPVAARFVFPVLVNDGAHDCKITLEDGLSVNRPGGAMEVKVLAPAGVTKFALEPQRFVTHNGYVQAAVADLPMGTREVRWKMQLHPQPLEAASPPPAR